MTWITGSEDGSVHSGTAAGGWCHAVDPETWTTACGAFTSTLQLWPEVPFQRARMAGGEPCPACVASVDREHAGV